MISKIIYKNPMVRISILLFVMVFSVNLEVNAQADIPVGFTPRTSSKASSPHTNQQNYYLKGDFTMFGNTNMTLRDYGDETNNSGEMIYIDIDGDPNTVNSSMAVLELPDPECTEVVYAGLYWSGRAHDGGTSANTFTVPDYNGGTIQTMIHNNTLGGFNLQITGTTGNSGYVQYQFGSGSSGYQVRFYNTAQSGFWVAYRSGTSGTATWTNIPGTRSISGTTATYVLDVPLNIGDLSIRELKRSAANSSNNSTVRANANVTVQIAAGTKTLNKTQVKFKHASDGYQTITAATGQVYYPSNNHGNIYVAYSDITDYVRDNKDGEYYLADLAVREGNGGSTGFIGGWGMVVVYKNQDLNWRNITVFDGYGYIQHSGTSGVGQTDHELPVSGFTSVQHGEVKVDMGLMAAEGDNGISGDFFEIRNAADDAWVRLSHSGNSQNNFFNSSIVADGPRNPSLLNNTGIDLSKWTLNNTGNTIIDNEQTSTRFRFGTNQDLYVIYSIVFGVDAYVPEVLGENTVAAGGSIQPSNGDTLVPGDDFEFDLKLYNFGTEAINDVRIEIPLPLTLHLMSWSIDSSLEMNGGTISWEPPPGAPAGSTSTDVTGGKLVWDAGTMPYHEHDPERLLGHITYKFKVTEDCALLALLYLTADECALTGNINGRISGTGAISQSDMNIPLVSGYTTGACAGPIYSDFELFINVEDYLETCQVDDGALVFEAHCDNPDEVEREVVTNEYPAGAKFYTEPPSSYDDTTGLVEGNFATTQGENTEYYVVLPGMLGGCHLTMITVRPTCDTYDFDKDCSFNDVNEDGVAWPGMTIAYTFTVTNRGEMEVYNVKIVDPLFGFDITVDNTGVSPSSVTMTGDSNNDGVLDKDETWVFTLDYTITQEDIDRGYVHNTASVTGTSDAEGDEVLDPEADECQVDLKASTLILTNPSLPSKSTE